MFNNTLSLEKHISLTEKVTDDLVFMSGSNFWQCLYKHKKKK